MEVLIIIGITLLTLVIVFVVAPYLKQKNIINQDSVYITEQILLLAKLISSKNIKDEKDKEKVLNILEAIRNVIKRIEESANEEDSQVKRSLAKKQIVEKLILLDIEIDEETEQIIDIILSNVVRFMPKNDKNQ